MDIALQKSISNKVKRIDRHENLRLLQLFKKHGVRFTENMNGCFIDLTDVDVKILNEADEFLDMCIEVHMKNDERNAQIKQYTQEFEQSFVPIRTTGNNRPCNNQGRENEFLHAIKNDKNLNSLEKSIMKENLKFSLGSTGDGDKVRKSVTPKYSGLKARLLKNCRTATRNIPAFNANSIKSFTQPTENVSIAQTPVDDEDELDVEAGETDDVIDDIDDDIDIADSNYD